jgi:hypothetical protein
LLRKAFFGKETLERKQTEKAIGPEFDPQLRLLKSKSLNTIKGIILYHKWYTYN